MRPPPDPALVRAIRDREHLDLLGLFNYLAAAFCGLGALGMLPLLLILESGLFRRLMERGGVRPVFGGPPAPAPGELFRLAEDIFPTFLGLALGLLVAAAVACLLSGRFLRSRRNRGFSTVVAAVQCLAVPLGTILGVLTLMTLGRPSVQDLYGERERP